MALRAAGPQRRRCLQAAAAQQRQQFSGSALAGRAAAKGQFEDMQDPSKTRQAYSHEPEGREVPGPEAEGMEREIKWGQNIPASPEQAKEELKSAGKGLAESVEQGVGVLLSKAKDTVAAAQRAMGMSSSRTEMSAGTMGAAGKMEHAPPGASSGGPSGNAEAKYQEISDTEKPHFPQGEQSFPDMYEAASLQSNTPEGQMAESERIRSELRKPQ
ncbi:transcriptional regulator [Chlorella sorokiniana]|uniref:Transcriptional regulator n=1 Tax=Chlorella sorokiniana TaxID=3076 RepID=A0A2P6TZX2_CHLSO|nr:transcriptional regulator [Chlorella sorokiniana]|eukprot:PRW59608.1 transcriptional regulator [Chlorella sorokiniana]